MFSIKNQSIGHSIAFNEYGKFNAYLPKEFYDAIESDLVKIYKKNKVNLMWDDFDKFLLTLDINEISEANDNEIINIMKAQKTNNRKYDPDGEKPFFIGWARHRKNDVSTENLNKTERYFGIEIKELCINKNVSSRWSDTIHSNSLDLDPKKAENEINNIPPS